MIISKLATRQFLRQGAKMAARGLATTTAQNSAIWNASAFSNLTKLHGQRPNVFNNHQKYGGRQRAQKSTLAWDDSHDNPESRDSYNVSQTLRGKDACKKVGIDKLGITNPTTIYRNMTYQELFEHEQANNEGVVAKTKYGDTFQVSTGKYTGRSPKDKFVVFNPGSESAENMDWNDINQPTSAEVFDELEDKAIKYFNTIDKAYVFDCYVGASPASRKKIRFVHEMAWQQHFCTNMFIRPVSSEELDDFEPDFTVINACADKVEDYERLGLNSETAVAFNIEEGKAVIFGTWYGGENKKGIFSLMNYLLPLSNPPQLPMHCSANVGKDGDVCLFFGLSGTGKTTLSADPHRALIGDDEHGWDEHGVYNFEGGCYAKTINLAEETEPDIYRAIHTDALLENVMIDPYTSAPDYFDTSITENGRVSYPIFHIDGYVSEDGRDAKTDELKQFILFMPHIYTYYLELRLRSYSTRNRWLDTPKISFFSPVMHLVYCLPLLS
mmetsp:Transcript_19127/g.41539  ORF Transcript_19127/g.41539 Transcript_19127/m.41539 type:complete len:498 (-) Transcript_19127:873-2366(-)